MFIILISERVKINPDNVATPIASSLGDLVTLAILSGFGTFLYISRETLSWKFFLEFEYINLLFLKRIFNLDTYSNNRRICRTNTDFHLSLLQQRVC